MAGIFSVQFFSVAGGTNATYTVPAGSTAVLRHLAIFNVDSGSDHRYQLNEATGGVVLVLGRCPPYTNVPGVLSTLLDVRIVLKGGQQLRSYNDAGINMTASGYLFSA